MAGDKRDLLKVLQAELEFLERGGYRNPPEHAAWRPQFIFEDSPTCLRYGDPQTRGSCSDCVLLQFVPPAHRRDDSPCWHIPLNAEGETLDSLYRWDTQEEIETKVAQWLRTTIERLERERAETISGNKKSGQVAGQPGRTP